LHVSGAEPSFVATGAGIGKAIADRLAAIGHVVDMDRSVPPNATPRVVPATPESA